jgi:hypothetical protein
MGGCTIKRRSAPELKRWGCRTACDLLETRIILNRAIDNGWDAKNLL